MQAQVECQFCKMVGTKVKIKNHLLQNKCEIKAQEEKTKQPLKDRVTLLEVKSYHKPAHVLLIEAGSTKTLDDLDQMLRRVWLECCGHLSAFTLGGITYNKSAEDLDMMYYDDKAQLMNDVLLSSLEKNTVLEHEYDFGSTTELKITILDRYESVLYAPTGMTIMARNVYHKEKCSFCEQEAEYICSFCYEEFSCKKHKKSCACVKKEGETYMLLPLSNSPRAGVCGYEGTSPQRVKIYMPQIKPLNNDEK